MIQIPGFKFFGGKTKCFDKPFTSKFFQRKNKSDAGVNKIQEYAWLKMSEKSAVIENLRTTFPFYVCLVRSLALERQSFLFLDSNI